MRPAFLLAMVFGCGRIGFAPGGASDGGTDGTTDSLAATCTTYSAWGPSVPISGFEGAEPEFDVNLSRNRLEMWLVVSDGSQFDLAVATRPTATGTFGTPAIVMSTPVSADTDPSITEDGLDLFFQSDRNAGLIRPFTAHRNTIGDAFGMPIPVPGIEMTNVYGLEITPDGLGLYMNDTDLGLAVSTRPNRQAPFSPPMLVAAGPGTFPSVSPDGLELYFHDAAIDISRYTRASTATMFTDAPSKVSLDIVSRDPDVWFDGLEMLFHDDAMVYRVTRTCLD